MLGTISILGREVSFYSICMGIGVLVVLLALPRFAERRGVGGYVVSEVALYCAPFAVAGAVLLYGLTNADVIVRLFEVYGAGGIGVHELLSGLVRCFGGMVFYGGLIGSACGLAVWVRFHKDAHVADVIDLYALAVPLFHAIARVGCFLSGCCYGVEFSPGVVMAGSPIPGAASCERFPVQLVESFGEAIIFMVLLRLFVAWRMRGELPWVWVALYAPMRFALEFLRGDMYRGFLGPLSTSQWVSVALVACLLLHVARHRLGRRSDSQAACGA